MKRLVIFDLDGTLLNTIKDLGEAANVALSQCGYPVHPLDAYPMFVGGGVRKLLERVVPQEARTEENIEKLREHFTAYYDAHLTDHTVPYPGMPELLRELTERKVRLAVASNKYQAATSAIIKHFFPDIPWGAVEGSKEGVPVKPDPSIVFQILSKVPTPKSQVLYCGDSGVDIETAKRACVDVAGVTWGFRSVRELRQAGADIIVDHPREILDLVEKDSVLL